MNIVSITGNLCKDHDVRIMTNRKKVIRNTIASKRNFKDKDGNYESDFINIVVFEPSANFVEQYTSKGDKIGVTGRWQHRSYEDTYGNKKYVDECVVDEIELLAKTQKTTPSYNDIYERAPEPEVDANPWATEDDGITEDDLPF